MTGLIEITTSSPSSRTKFLTFLSFPTASSSSSSSSLVSLLQFLISHRLGSNRIIWSVADLPPLPAFRPLPFLPSCGCLFVHLAQASSGDDIAYKHQKEKILTLRPVSPSPEYTFQVITFTAPSSPWVWGGRRALMLYLWHKGALTAREVWKIRAYWLRMGIQLLDPKEVSNAAQPILTMPTLLNKRGPGTDFWLPKPK